MEGIKISTHLLVLLIGYATISIAMIQVASFSKKITVATIYTSAALTTVIVIAALFNAPHVVLEILQPLNVLALLLAGVGILREPRDH